MSRETVEVVSRLFRAFASGGVDAALSILAADVEWNVRDDLPDAGTYRGHDGFRELVGRFDDAFEEQVYEPLDYIEAGERVVVPLRWWARGRSSGATVVERQETWTFTVRDGKIAAVEEFARRSDALEAAGLSE